MIKEVKERPYKKFTKAHHKPFLEWIRGGKTIRGYAREHKMDHACISHELARNEALRHQYQEAFDQGLLVDIDRMREIAFEGSKDFEARIDKDGQERIITRMEHVQRSKLICDTIQWQAKRRFPKNYGDKMVDDEGKAVSPAISISFEGD